MSSFKSRIEPIVVVGLRAIYTVISLAEAPFFLWRNRELFKNKIVYVFFHWSFGHSVTGIDYASRLYYPHRISLIHVPHPGSNPYLPRCFEHNMDVYSYRSLLPSCAFGHLDRQKYYVLRLYLLILSGLFEKFQLIEHFNIYSTLSLAQDKMLTGNNATGRLDKLVDYTGYIKLVREKVGQNPRMPTALQEPCRRAIEAADPGFFQKPFAALLLRGKGKNAPIDSRYRCSGPHENYRPAVQLLQERGYRVVGIGETDHSVFKDLPAYVSLDRVVGVSPALLNLFILMNSALFIGQQSGPLNLADACGIPCLICDAVPYRLGTFCEQDIILFKHIKDLKTGKRLTPADVYLNYPDLAYGCGIQSADIAFEENSAEEILAALEETLGLMDGTLHLSPEDERLCATFRSLPAPGMGMHYQRNRTSLVLLRQMKDQLINTKMNQRSTS